MKWPKLSRRQPTPAPPPWTPGRIIDLFLGQFAGLDRPDGLSVSVGFGIGGTTVNVLAGRVGPGGFEGETFKVCCCPTCIAGMDYREAGRQTAAKIAEMARPDPFEFKVPAPERAEAN